MIQNLELINQQLNKKDSHVQTNGWIETKVENKFEVKY